MPLRCCNIFNAVRSAANKVCAGPSMVASGVPALTLSPSFTCAFQCTSSDKAKNTKPAMSSPATTMSSRAFRLAEDRAASEIVAKDVTSPPSPKSSSSASCITRSTAYGSSPSGRVGGFEGRAVTDIYSAASALCLAGVVAGGESSNMRSSGFNARIRKSSGRSM